MSRTQHIIFTATSLEHALSSVRSLHDMSTEVIAQEVFRQMSELAAHRLTPTTVWCGPGGLYQSKLDAARNGEQQIDSAILVDTSDLANLAVDMSDAHDAMRAADFANRRYSAAVQHTYPKGTKVRADVGGHLITVEITGYGSYWSNPGELYGTNVKTGKARHFSHRHVLEVQP